MMETSIEHSDLIGTRGTKLVLPQISLKPGGSLAEPQI
jgi:hypothetical protein